MPRPKKAKSVLRRIAAAVSGRPWWILVACLAAAAVLLLIPGDGGDRDPDKKLPESFSALLQAVESGDVEEIEVLPGKQVLRVTGASGSTYEVGYPSEEGPNGLEGLLNQASANDVDVESRPLPSNGLSVLSTILRMLPIVLIGAFFLIFAINSGMLGSRGAQVAPSDVSVDFSDVAGVGEGVEELREVQQFLKDPDRFHAIGASVPKGVLLYGPPGTGKTLLAKAIASEAGVPFYSSSGSEFVEMYAGLGAKRVRALFKQAKRNAPSIVFIDELDAVGQKRGQGSGDGGSREADQTLVEILRQMDGFAAGKRKRSLPRRRQTGAPEEDQHPIIVIGATNRLDSLDAALTRPGRFDRHIAIDPPDKKGRAEILEVHAANKKIDREVDLGLWAGKTAGMTGADLALFLNEAALAAARGSQSSITETDLDTAFLRLVAGAEKQHRTLSEAERRRIACHEAGHAIVREKLKDRNIVHKISIIPRGHSGGQTIHVSEEDVFLHPISQLQNTLATLLAGRAAEDLVLEEVSSGSADDLEKASELAAKMYSQLGMGETLGLLVDRGRLTISDERRASLDAEAKDLLDAQYRRAKSILSDHRREVDEITQVLLAEETIDRERFLSVLGWARDDRTA